MKLGNLRLSNNLMLAPMQNVSTGPFRRFCRKISKEIGLVCVPMLYNKRIVQKPESVEKDLLRIEEERPISVQLIGSNKNDLKIAIEFLESYKFDVLDLNAGCPSKRALYAKEGGYLMKDIETLNTLIKTAVKFSSRPVSIKIRSGYSENFNIHKFTSMLNDNNVQFVVIHGRTVKERYMDSKVDYEFIKKLKSTLTIPLIGNGDIFSPDDAKFFLKKTGVDGLMIGRGCIGFPEIFSQINNHLNDIENDHFQNNIDKMKRNLDIYEKIVDRFLDAGLNLPNYIEIQFGFQKELEILQKFEEIYLKLRV
jgi:tRNA-dihydrouridine synthase B